MTLALAGVSGAFAGTTTGTTQTTVLDQGPANDMLDGGFGPAISATGTFTLPRYTGDGVLVEAKFSASSGAWVSASVNTLPPPFASPTVVGETRLSGTYTVGSSGFFPNTASGEGTRVVSTTGTARLFLISPYETTTARLAPQLLWTLAGADVVGTVTESVAVWLSWMEWTSEYNRTLTVNTLPHQATVTYTYTDQGHANGSIGAETYSGGFSRPGVDVNALSRTFQGSLAGGWFQPGESSSPYWVRFFNGPGLFPMDVFGGTCSGDCDVFQWIGWNQFGAIPGGGQTDPVTVRFLGATPTVPTSYRAEYTFFAGDSEMVAGGGKIRTIEKLGMIVMAQVVPEPQEWAMMLLGLAMVGAAARRRRVKLRAR